MTRLPTTAEPSRPLRSDFWRTVTASSATSRISSTTMPTLRSPSLKTTTCTGSARLLWSAAPGSSTVAQRHQGKNAVAVLHHLASARMLDGRLRELLQPGDQRKRHGQALEGTGPEQKQPLLLDSRLRLLFRRRARLLAGFGQHPGALADAQHIEDEGHPAVAHDGCAGIHA